MEKPTSFAVRIAAAAALFSVHAPAMAGGYYIQEQSAKETGRAYSGDAAAADSAATVFFNPAAMTELEGLNLDANVHAIFVTTNHENRGSFRTVPGSASTPGITGNGGGTPFPQPLVVPSSYASYQVDDRLWLGLAVFSPYGLMAEYDEDFFGRYDSRRSELFTLNVQPSVAYKLSDNVSIGGGVDIQYAKVHLTSAVPGFLPGDPDGFLDVTGDDISMSWNAGIFLKSGALRAGLHYRNEMKHELEGDFVVTGLTGPLAGANVATSVDADLNLPDIATLSLAYDNGGPGRLYATARWYDWSDFEEIRLEPLGLDDAVNTQNYKDSWSVAVGGEYDVSERLTLRTGTMFDATPTQDGFRTTRVPDGDRTWLSAGATYKLTDHMEVNLAYAHIWMESGPITRTETFFDGTPAVFTTDTRSRTGGNIDMVSIGVSSRF
ncbi:OmpP1/FadL family transporter [Paraurantiacibacter namhicola]|uniref:Putative outer membrane protein n=1 Tax=Paraurantiacibacter namhicola TaxID=645517 RepID=A0A1C7DBH7_9SPHN|nr:outer membrane protein transport protein [Paraurantiacibacter namhicola]ANU08805.1 Putative outer membrane protein precursor [Paraurantiacibacter namhicola]